MEQFLCAATVLDTGTTVRSYTELGPHVVYILVGETAHEQTQ